MRPNLQFCHLSDEIEEAITGSRTFSSSVTQNESLILTITDNYVIAVVVRDNQVVVVLFLGYPKLYSSRST